MQRPDPRTSARRRRITLPLTLSVGVLLLAALAPVPQPGVHPRASIGEDTAAVGRAATVENADSGAAGPLPSPPRPSPMLDGLDERSDFGRVDASVRAPAPVAATRRAAGLKAVFLGDSYTSGWNGAGIGRRGWPAIVGRALGWRTVNLAVAGTGFMNPGWTGQTVGSRVTATIRLKPDIVVVAAGHNDSRWSAATTARAAHAVLDRLHRGLPDAVFVVVAPIWSNGTPPARCLDLRDQLRRKARSMRAIFIDPLADRWFAGTRERLIGADGVHPTDAGHRHIARRVLDVIAAN